MRAACLRALARGQDEAPQPTTTTARKGGVSPPMDFKLNGVHTLYTCIALDVKRAAQV